MELMKILFFNFSGLKMKLFLFLAISFALSSCSFQKMYQANAARSQQSYEQINFVDLVKKYVSKDKPESKNIEGIYSVSITVFKRSKGLFSSGKRDRMIEQ